jgi:hypothetical protein
MPTYTIIRHVKTKDKEMYLKTTGKKRQNIYKETAIQIIADFLLENMEPKGERRLLLNY